MKTKIFTSVLLGIFALILSIGAVSAFTLTSSDIVYGQSPTEFTVTGDTGINQTLSIAFNPAIISDGNSFTILTSTSTLELNGTESKTFTVNLVNFENLKFGDYSSTINITSSNATELIRTIDFVKGFCQVGDVGTGLEIYDITINNLDGDDDKWNPLDEISVEVKVKNIRGDDDEIQDVIVELGFFDDTGENRADELFSDEDDVQVDLGDIEDGKKETAEFKFKVPVSFEEDDYKLTAKVFSDDEDESSLCINTAASDFSSHSGLYDTLDIKKDSRDVVLDDIKINPEKATPGERVVLTANVFNAGEKDEDKVVVTVYNAELGLNEEISINDLNEGDEEGESISLEFTVPNVGDGTYTIELTTAFDYDEDTGETTDSSEKTWGARLEVFGSSATPGDFADVTAEIESDDVVAGQELVIKATIENTASSQKSFIIDLSGYSDWADIDSVSDRLLTLDAGESEDIKITFTINDDAEGEESFTLDVLSGDQTDTNEIKVNITPKSSLLDRFNGENSLIWVIGAINLLLIILIIMVAVRLSRR